MKERGIQIIRRAKGAIDRSLVRMLEKPSAKEVEWADRVGHAGSMEEIDKKDVDRFISGKISAIAAPGRALFSPNPAYAQKVAERYHKLLETDPDTLYSWMVRDAQDTLRRDALAQSKLHIPRYKI